jgi:peptidoglycan hydrolase CwlO-like protein
VTLEKVNITLVALTLCIAEMRIEIKATQASQANLEKKLDSMECNLTKKHAEMVDTLGAKVQTIDKSLLAAKQEVAKQGTEITNLKKPIKDQKETFEVWKKKSKRLPRSNKKYLIT